MYHLLYVALCILICIALVAVHIFTPGVAFIFTTIFAISMAKDKYSMYLKDIAKKEKRIKDMQSSLNEIHKLLSSRR